MKAALEAWGAESNLFHQGVARESDDPDVVSAAMSKPGVILRRPVGSSGSFKEDAELNLSGDRLDHRPQRPRAKPNRQRPLAIDDKAARKAAVAFERSGGSVKATLGTVAGRLLHEAWSKRATESDSNRPLVYPRSGWV
jgi:hypothetical protein